MQGEPPNIHNFGPQLLLYHKLFHFEVDFLNSCSFQTLMILENFLVLVREFQNGTLQLTFRSVF